MVKFGSISGTICDKHGYTVGHAKLHHVAHSYEMKFNVCSVSRLIQDGWNLKGNTEMIWVVKNDLKLNFDIKFTTASGVVYCMYMQHDTEISNPAVVCNIMNEENTLRLGHSYKDATRATAKVLGMNIKRGGLNHVMLAPWIWPSIRMWSQ
jgi:hypothetical protein